MNGKVIASGYYSTSTQSVSNIGGIVGSNYSVVTKCYNVGIITTEYDDIGGIVGYSSSGSKINCCYNIGTITGNNFVGGIVGWSAAEIRNCYYLDGTAMYGGNNMTSMNGIEQKSSNYMKSSDFLDVLNINSNIFKIEPEKNNGYPILKWQ